MTPNLWFSPGVYMTPVLDIITWGSDTVISIYGLGYDPPIWFKGAGNSRILDLQK